MSSCLFYTHFYGFAYKNNTIFLGSFIGLEFGTSRSQIFFPPHLTAIALNPVLTDLLSPYFRPPQYINIKASDLSDMLIAKHKIILIIGSEALLDLLKGMRMTICTIKHHIIYS